MATPTEFEIEQRTRMEAAGHPTTQGEQFWNDIAGITREFVERKIAQAVEPLHARIAELEAHPLKYEGVWTGDKAYQQGRPRHEQRIHVAREELPPFRGGRVRTRTCGRW